MRFIPIDEPLSLDKVIESFRVLAELQRPEFDCIVATSAQLDGLPRVLAGALDAPPAIHCMPIFQEDCLAAVVVRAIELRGQGRRPAVIIGEEVFKCQ